MSWSLSWQPWQAGRHVSKPRCHWGVSRTVHFPTKCGTFQNSTAIDLIVVVLRPLRMCTMLSPRLDINIRKCRLTL